MSDRCKPHGARACRRCETTPELAVCTCVGMDEKPGCDHGASEFKRANDNAEKLRATRKRAEAAYAALVARIEALADEERLVSTSELRAALTEKEQDRG